MGKLCLSNPDSLKPGGFSMNQRFLSTNGTQMTRIRRIKTDLLFYPPNPRHLRAIISFGKEALPLLPQYFFRGYE
jgi:hypothetical protein